MREYAKKPENQSRTLDSNPGVSKQAPIDVILQRYRQNMQQYTSKEDGQMMQGKLNIVQHKDKDELLQGKFKTILTAEQESQQQEEKTNNTGLPENLKTGIEKLSGYSMENLKVHYNSSKPTQLQALAYTQGVNIHIAPGQEKQLPHEAWHVVQQKQGRVHPTGQLQGINVNNNEGLEKEADVMGIKANTTQIRINDSLSYGNITNSTFQRKIQISGSSEYTTQVFNQIDILLGGDWEGIKRNGSTLEIENKYIEKTDEFISIGRTPAAKLVRRRIANRNDTDCEYIDPETIIEETYKASSTNEANKVSWNSEEKMICYTKNGFEINPPVILLAHELGHVDGFLSGETVRAYEKVNDQIEITYKIPDSEDEVMEYVEELRNTGIAPSNLDSRLDNPFSENEIRKSMGLSERVIYTKLISWWIKNKILTLDPPVNQTILKYYNEVVGLRGVEAIIEEEINKDLSLKAKKKGITKKIMNYIETYGSTKTTILLNEIPNDTTSKPSDTISSSSSTEKDSI